MDVFDLVAKLSLDQSEYESGLSDAQTKASGFGSGLKTAMGVGAVAVGAVTTAVAGVTTAFGHGVAGLAEYGDNIDKMSQKMGISAEKYQEWDAVMQHSGTSMETMKASMKTLANAVENGNDAFQRLGLSQEQLATMSQEDIFEATIAGLQNVEDTTERTYLAGQLLGRGATELGALLNTSAEDTQAMRDRVHELGGVMSDEAVKASAGFQDSLQDMTTAFDGLKRGMMADFLPSITTVMDGLTNIFAGDYDEGIDQVTEGIEQTINNASELIPKISEIGGGVLTALIDALTSNMDSILTAGAEVMGQLASALISNLPTIFDTAGQVLLQISEGIITHLPELVSVGMEVLVNLANGISSALPTLIPTIVSVVLQIGQTLIEHLPELIQAGLSIAMGLIQGLVEAIPLIVESLPTLIDAILTTLINSADLLLDGALQMFMAIVDAIPSIVNALASALPQIITKITTFLTGDGLPKVLQGAIQMLMAIIQAIPQIISALASAMPSIITSITTFLVTSTPMIVQAGIQLLGGLLKAIPQIISSLASAIPSIITSIVSALKAGISQITQVGRDLLAGLWNGMSDKVGWILDKVSGIGNSIIEKVNKIFGRHSPSRVFREIGNDLVLGLGLGWEDEIPEVNKMIEKDLHYKGDIDVSATTDLSNVRNTQPMASILDAQRNLDNTPINLYITNEVDGKRLNENSYTYTVGRMKRETNAVRIAHGGA